VLQYVTDLQIPGARVLDITVSWFLRYLRWMQHFLETTTPGISGVWLLR
jgi:hypothetical protein